MQILKFYPARARSGRFKPWPDPRWHRGRGVATLPESRQSLRCRARPTPLKFPWRILPNAGFGLPSQHCTHLTCPGLMAQASVLGLPFLCPAAALVCTHPCPMSAWCGISGPLRAHASGSRGGSGEPRRAWHLWSPLRSRTDLCREHCACRPRPVLQGPGLDRQL